MYKINKYPDGSGYVTTDNSPEEVFKVNSYEDLWFLAQLVDVKSNLGVYPTITIPNLIDAQADARFKDNQSHGLRLVLSLIGNLAAKFKVFHPHNDTVVGLYPNIEIIDNKEFVSEVLYSLYGFSKTEELSKILMAADTGGFKPLSRLCNQLEWRGELESASKAREYNDGVTKLTQIVSRLDFKGKDVLIVDDLSVGGGTFKGLSTILKTRNVGKLYLIVSHMTVQNLGKDPVTNYFDKVFTTNSKFDSYYIPHPETGLPDATPTNLHVINNFKTTRTYG